MNPSELQRQADQAYKDAHIIQDEIAELEKVERDAQNQIYKKKDEYNQKIKQESELRNKALTAQRMMAARNALGDKNDQPGNFPPAPPPVPPLI
jgi:hypothetical protein